MDTKKTYLWRKNFTATFFDQQKITRGKLAFKTKETDGLDTETPVVILVSIHSAFHEPGSGDLKMNALLSTIKEHVKGKVTVLLCDIAHLKTLILQNQGNVDKTYNDCLFAAQSLSERYEPYFMNCNVVYWHSYISQDKDYVSSLNSLKELYQTDSLFRKYLFEDAEVTYTDARMQLFSNKTLYILKTIEDLLEQCAGLMVLSKKGYRHKFYPGSSNASTLYVNQILLSQENQISWIDVFLSIEKKTITHLEPVEC